MFCLVLLGIIGSILIGQKKNGTFHVFNFFFTLKEDPELLKLKGKMLFSGQFFFFNRVGPVTEISLMLNQMYVFVFGLGSYLPAAAAT